MLIDRIKSQQGLIAGLDVGSSKVCVVVGEVLRSGVSIISVNSVPSSGVKKGIINDIDAAANSIRKAITGAEKLIGSSINEVFASIAGRRIKSFQSIGTTVITGGVVTDEDVEAALEAAADIVIPQDLEIVQILPVDFIIDGKSGIINPVGMSGSMLQVKAVIFSADIEALKNLIQSCDAAQIKVKDIILRLLASAEASLTSEDRKKGAAVIDIGGGVTEIAIYKHNFLQHTVFLGIGGNNFTNDLSIVLDIPFHEAERLKIDNNYLLPESSENQESELEITIIDEDKKKLHRKDISAILLARSEELLELIKKELNRTEVIPYTIEEIILTGGASLLPGFRQLAENILSIPVRIAYPEMVSRNSKKNTFSESQSSMLNSISPEFNQPVYATGIGLVIYGAESFSGTEKMITNRHFHTVINNKLTGFLKKQDK